MKPVRIAAIVLALLPALAAAGVIDTLWTRLYDGPSSNQINQAADMFVDTAHNRIYVCGSGEAAAWPGVTNMLTACYRLDGTFLWSQSYGGNTLSQDDMAHALAVDAAGNVYVAGLTQNTLPRGDDISWVKYDTAGTQVWAKKTLWSGDDDAFDIALGPDSSIYICGSGQDSVHSLSTFLLLKASTSTGDTIWTRSSILDTLAFKKKSDGRDFHPYFFDDFSYYDNCATAIAIAADSGIVVTGFGLHHSFEKEWWLKKYRPNGDTVWSHSYHNPTTIYTDDDDAAFDVAIAGTGDIYACGFDYYDDGASSQGYNYAVGRFNSLGIEQNWRSLNSGAVDGDEYATSLCLDNATPQNVYVTGMLSLPDGDLACTNRYSSTLTSRWGTAGAIYGTDEAYGYNVRYRSGRVYMTGYIDGGLGTVCYSETDPVPGNAKDSLWSFIYNTPGGYDALGASITALDSNRVWVAGQSDRSTSLTSLALLRFGYVNRDAAVDTVYAPRGMYAVGDSVTPRARISDAGTDSAFVRAWFTVGAAYRDSSAILKLHAGETTQVSFRRWTATVGGSFQARCSIATTGDPNAANNVKMAPVTVNDIDVGCYRIVAPPDTFQPGGHIQPQARVRNYGSTGQLFSVRFSVNDGFTDTVRNVSVPAGDSLLVTAARTWSPTQPGTWAVACSTMLAGDINPANDRATRNVIVPGHDIGVARIATPTGTVDSGANVVPKAVVRNYGVFTEAFDVNFSITGGYTSQVHVAALAPGESTNVVFTVWPVAGRDSLTAACWTSLAPDSNPANDTLRRRFFARVLDAALDSIIAPSGTINAGTLVTPQVRVTNHGNVGSFTPVRLTLAQRAKTAIAGSPGAAGLSRPALAPRDRDVSRLGTDFVYADSANIVVPANSTITVSLRQWLATIPETLIVEARTSLAGDMHPANDIDSGQVIVRGAPGDVGISSILAPIGVVDSGAAVVPRVVLTNYRTSTENPPIHLAIGSLYAVDTTVSIGPSRSDTLSFPSWTAGELGPLGITCFTALDGDAVPSNDTATGQVTVLAVVHDVGISSIVAPTDSVDSGAVVVPRVMLTNHGTAIEQTPVHLTIGTAYTADTTLRIGPGRSDTLAFPSWTAGELGALTVTCYTALPGDANPANDTAIGQVIVHVVVHDVGISSIIAPTDTVDSGTIVIPRVMLSNYGATVEHPPVHLAIGSFYVVDTTPTITPHGSIQLIFPPWFANEVGDLTITCYTALAGDADRSNDTATGQVTVWPQTGIKADPAALPRSFALAAPTPNPAAGRVTIGYALPRAAEVTLAIYDATGKLVRTLLDAGQPAGRLIAAWDGRDRSGRVAPEGIYYVRMETGGFTATRKLIIQR